MDSIVTARVSAEKKEAVARLLKQLGTTPSETINRLYDYILANHALPFPEEEKTA